MAHSHQVWIVNQDKETGKIEKKSLEAVCHNNSKSAEQRAQELTASERKVRAMKSNTQLQRDVLTELEDTGGAVTMLERLGHTADEVASTLRVKRIRGARYTVRFLNPVIRYVRTEIADAQDMEIVDDDRLNITFDDGRKANITLPQGAKEFLDAFNQRAYLDLELPVGSP